MRREFQVSLTHRSWTYEGKHEGKLDLQSFRVWLLTIFLGFVIFSPQYTNAFALNPLNLRDEKAGCRLLRGCNSERVQLENQRYFQSLLQVSFFLQLFLIIF